MAYEMPRVVFNSEKESTQKKRMFALGGKFSTAAEIIYDYEGRPGFWRLCRKANRKSQKLPPL